MYSPKRLTVRRAPCCSVISGVPVNAMRVALGKASDMLSDSPTFSADDPCVRCASSIISTMRSEALTTPKVLPDGAALYAPKASATRLGSARSEEHTSELQSLMRNSYAVFCLKKKHKT